MYKKVKIAVQLLSILTLSGCASLTADVHKEFINESTPPEDIAIIRAETASIHEIDGITIKHPDANRYYKEIHLPPGSHTITLYRWFAVSVLLVRKGYIEVVSEPFEVDLKPGHIYELHGDRTTGVIRVILWIEDSTTGEIIAREADPRVLR